MEYVNNARMIREDVCDAIYMVIPEVPRLVKLFHSWSNLDAISKNSLDQEAESWSCTKKIELYWALTEAFTKWEDVQATEGAPGCDPQSFEFSSNSQLEQELLSMIQNLETMVALCNEQNNGSDYAKVQKIPKRVTYNQNTKKKRSSERFIKPKSSGDHSGYKTE